jgi:hypothetical protein
MNWFSSTSRDILRWYLRKFPLRVGKTFLYQLSPQLTPPERFVTAALNASGTDKHEIQELLGDYGYVPSFPYKTKWYRARDVNQVKSRNLLWFDPGVRAHWEKTARLPIIEEVKV